MQVLSAIHESVIQNLGDDMDKWRDIFRVICSKCDFRQLLLLKRVSKKLLDVVNLEIQNRQTFITGTESNSSSGFYSDATFWYLGRICLGFSILDRVGYNRSMSIFQHEKEIAEMSNTAIYPCSKWEEITLFGEKRLCRTCLALKTAKSKEEADKYGAHLHKLRVEREHHERCRREEQRRYETQRTGQLKFQPKNK